MSTPVLGSPRRLRPAVVRRGPVGRAAFGPAETSPATATRVAPAGAARPDTRWMDVARLVAIVCVVLIHADSPVTKTGNVPPLSASWWVANVWNAAALFCVPLFVMISGALLLQPKAARDPGAFLGRRLGKVLVPLVFWSAFYLWFRQSVLGQRMTIWRALDDIAAGHPFLQLYFLFIIVGLYFVTPILARLVHDGRREFATVTFGALLFGVLDQTVQSFAGKGGVNALTWFVPYVGYYLAGRLLRDVQLSRRRVTLAGLGFLLSVAAIVLGTALGIAVGDRTLGVYLFSYLSPAVVVMSVSAYLLFRALPLGRVPAATLRRLGNATFGVFLLHPVLLFPPLLHLGWPSSVLGVALGVPAIAVGVTAASLAIALLASRVPVVRALV